jgi:integrase
MSDEIKVTVLSYPDRNNLVLAYVDPVSGKRKTKSAKTAIEKKAWQEAAKWEEELLAGEYCPPSKVTWKQFREKYEEEKASTLAAQTQHSIRHALNAVEKYLNPDRLCKLTSPALAKFALDLTKPRKVKRKGEDVTLPPMRPASAAKILRHVRAALAWAASKKRKMLAVMPEVEMPKGGAKMKGGALVGEQFERMLAAILKVRAASPGGDAAEWHRYLNGLYLGGLRLGEGLALSWDAKSPFAVDLSGRHPRFRIKGSAQKSRKDELVPMTPDFAEFLMRTPKAERHGRVFKLVDVETGAPLGEFTVSKMVSAIGEAAGVIVDPVEGKTATAHDLRRSFCTRWAKRVMPAVLRKLARHANIATTMSFYVDLDADEVADDLWTNHRPTGGSDSGNISGNTPPSSGAKGKSLTDVSSCEAST